MDNARSRASIAGQQIVSGSSKILPCIRTNAKRSYATSCVGEEPCLFGSTQIAWRPAVKLDVISKVRIADARGACKVQNEC